jgi:uncharacterized protein
MGPVTDETAERVVGPPPRTPYHRMARTSLHRWWRPPLGTFVVVAGYLAIASGLGLLAHAHLGDVLWFREPLIDLGLQLLALVSLIPLVFFAVRVIERRPIGTVSSVLGRLRWKWLRTCLCVSIVVPLVLGTTLWLLPEGRAAELLGDEIVGGHRLLLASIVLLLIVPLQAAAEEYAFRGWFVQFFGAYIRTPWPGIAIASVVFAFAHGLGTWWGLVNLLLWGAVLGWLTVRTGGLEAAIGFHVATNTPFFLARAATGLADSQTLTDVSTISAAYSDWQILLAQQLSLAAYAVGIVLVTRRTKPAPLSS